MTGARMTVDHAAAYLTGVFDQIEAAIVAGKPTEALDVVAGIIRDGHPDVADVVFDGVREILAARLRRVAALVEARTGTGGAG